MARPQEQAQVLVESTAVSCERPYPPRSEPFVAPLLMELLPLELVALPAFRLQVVEQLAVS